jgi:hypothetical protein
MDEDDIEDEDEDGFEDEDEEDVDEEDEGGGDENNEVCKEGEEDLTDEDEEERDEIFGDEYLEPTTEAALVTVAPGRDFDFVTFENDMMSYQIVLLFVDVDMNVVSELSNIIIVC